MIDLHIHSKYSDGSFSVIEILKEAERRKLDYISITDHDCIDAYNEIKNISISNYYSGKIITGCEFKCFLNEYKIPIEILGYNIKTEKLKNYFYNSNIMKVQSKYLEILKLKAKEIGLIYNNDLKLTEKHCYASAVFQDEILKYPENKEILKNNNISVFPNFYRAEQCNKNSIFYIDENKNSISIGKLLEKIHEAKGLAFLAHPYIYPIDDTEEMVEYVAKKYKLDGIECYYSTFSEKQKQAMINCTQKYNLYISGGTDFHGVSKPDIEVGTGRGNFYIKKEVISDWINKINKFV